MDSEVWRNLPHELLERTLSFLSIPEIFRLRTVCRRWNDLIHDPGFVHGAAQEYIVARWEAQGDDDGENRANVTENQGYSFLDVHSKAWYPLRGIGPLDGNDVCIAGSVAMDGGLVCYVLNFESGNSFYLTNPVLNLSRRLPPPPYLWTTYHGLGIKLDMAVTDRACTIFLMPGPGTPGALHFPMVTYDTTSNQWRTAANLPALPTGQESRVACSVVFGGSLYALLIPRSDLDLTSEYWLWRYDASSWSYTGVAIRDCVLADPKLMASGDSRMLLGAWKLSYSGASFYELSEVVLERRVVERVVSVDAELFGFEDEWDFEVGSVDAVSMGERVVVVWKPSGSVRIFDLRTREWDESVPDHPVAAEGPVTFCMWYGKAMHLNLPSSTLWIHESRDA